MLALLFVAAAAASSPASEPPQALGLSERTLGVHLGLNATLAFDARLGHWFYAEAATQLTGGGAIFDLPCNWVVTLLLLAGVGVLAGLRVVHKSGFTFAFKLPLIGYVGNPQAPRGGVEYYYVAAIPTVPLVTFGYSFAP